MNPNELAARELDAEVAQATGLGVPFWMRNQYDCDGDWVRCDKADRGAQPFIYDDIMVAHYTTDISAAFQAEEFIYQLDLEEKYSDNLKRIVAADYGYSESDYIIRDGRGWYDGMMFQFIHASPLQRCRAALKTLGAR